MADGQILNANSLAGEIQSWIQEQNALLQADGSVVRPQHYVPWKWPLHPPSADYLLSPEDWSLRDDLILDCGNCTVEVAEKPFGVFGRIKELKAEAMGANRDEMLANLKRAVKPLLDRQSLIATLIGNEEPRYRGSIRELSPLNKLKLFYAPDRAIAHDAQIEIEASGNSALYGPALIAILNEHLHPHRRTAQWLVLDLFEELKFFCPDYVDQTRAVHAIRDLMHDDAGDDYARTIYKAGVVLGGHICTEDAADALIGLIKAPSKIARRSAIHAVFHLAEWLPSRKEQIVAAEVEASKADSEPLLREFAACMARDIAAEEVEHVTEPVFPEEK